LRQSNSTALPGSGGAHPDAWPVVVQELRDIDIDDTLAKMLKDFIGERKAGRLFASRKGTPLAHGNIRNRVITPRLKKLGIPKVGPRDR
jgi:hypothetical protein